MATRLPMIGLVLGFAGTGFAATPGMFELGVSAPSRPGGHLAYSTYFGETKFVQFRFEESFLGFRPRISNVHHALIGAGYEQEFSSHLFLRFTAGLGIGQAALRSQPGPSQDTYFSSVQIAPDLTWFPSGRFSTIGLGINAGVNLQYRQALGDRALPSKLSNQGAQIFAGLVL